jgi:hypothetical protein
VVVAADSKVKAAVLPDIADRRGVRAAETPLIVRYDDLDAVVTSHQHTILGSAELGDAHRQPYADSEQGHREGESGDIGQHPLPIIVSLFRDAFIARQIVGNLETTNEWRLVAALAKR